MNLKGIKTAIKHNLVNTPHIPITIEGEPGTGKTSAVFQAGEEYASDHDLIFHEGLVDEPRDDMFCIVSVAVPLKLVEDFGIPHFDGDNARFHYRMPDWFPIEGRSPSKGILLFDDRNQATPDIQKVLANIQYDRKLHGTPLAKGWSIVNTGNRASDRAGSNRVLSHLRDREVVLNHTFDLDEWRSFADASGAHESIIAYSHWRPDNIQHFDPARDVNPTARSWLWGVNSVLPWVTNDKTYMHSVLSGIVGEGVAAEFVGFYDMYKDLPDPQWILATEENAKTVPLPPKEKPDQIIAIVIALAKKTNGDNLKAGLTFARRLRDMGFEFELLYYKRLVKEESNKQASAIITNPLFINGVLSDPDVSKVLRGEF